MTETKKPRRPAKQSEAMGRPSGRATLDLQYLLSEYGIVVALIVIIVFFGLATDGFFSVQNGINVIRQISTIGMMAVGQALVILAGGIDVSVGSIVGLGGMVAALAIRDLGVSAAIGTLVGVASGALLGLVNGLVITRLRVNAFLATLAMLSIARGAVYIISGQRDVAYDAPFLGRGRMVGLPVPIILLVLAAAVGWLIESRTTFGRSVHAIGGNPSASRLSGLPVNRVTISTFIASGALAALAGVMIASQIDIAVPYQGTGAELDVIAAVLVGGVALFGGRGSVLHAILGAIFIGMLGNGMALMNVPAIIQLIVKGIAMVSAVAIYNTARGRREEM